MKLLLFFAFCILLLSCVSQKKIMDSWLGSHKQDLIFKNGPPARIASDGGTGEILIYSYPAYNPFTHTSFYKYTMYYADNTGIIYRWMIQQGMIPPEQMDVNLYIR